MTYGAMYDHDIDPDEYGDEEICGETYDHDFEQVDERDGIATYFCACGAEIQEEVAD